MTKQNTDFISIYKNVIDSLKTQKAQNIKALEKYRVRIEDEASLESNKYMAWTKSVDPMLDSVISTQVTEHLLSTRYEEFIEALIKYITQLHQTTDSVDNLRALLDIVVEKFDTAERQAIDKIYDLTRNKQESTLQVSELQQQLMPLIAERDKLAARLITIYHRLPENLQNKGQNFCQFCGTTMNSQEINLYKAECHFCHQIPIEQKHDIVDRARRAAFVVPAQEQHSAPINMGQNQIKKNTPNLNKVNYSGNKNELPEDLYDFAAGLILENPPEATRKK